MNKEDQNVRYEKWRAIIDEQEASGLTQTAFCKEHNISSAQLSYYRGILKPKQTVSTRSFTPVTLKQSSHAKEIRVLLPNGFQCTFAWDFNVSDMKAWVKALLSC